MISQTTDHYYYDEGKAITSFDLAHTLTALKICSPWWFDFGSRLSLR